MAADPTFSNRTYAGEHFLDLFGPTVLNPAGLEDNQLATVIDRFKYKGTIYEADDTVVFQDPSPLYSDQSTTADIDEVNMTLVPYDFGKTISLDEIRESWYSNRLSVGSLEDYTMDVLVDSYLADIYVPKLNAAQNHLVVAGKVGLDSSVGSYGFSASYSGLYNLLHAASGINTVSLESDAFSIDAVDDDADPTVLSVTVSPIGSLNVGDIISIRGGGGTGWAGSVINNDFTVLDLSATSVTIDLDSSALDKANYDGNAKLYWINNNNIISKVASHIRNMPLKVRRKNPKIVIPAHLEYEWQFAMGAVQQDGSKYLKAYDLQMIDKQMVVLDDAPANTIGSWEPTRVYYGYDLSEDYSSVQVLWQGDTTGDKVYRLLGKMKTSVAITGKFENEITLTTPGAIGS